MKFTGVTSDQITDIWPLVFDLVVRGIGRYGDFSTQEIFEGLMDRSRQLWVSGDRDIQAILITRLDDNESERVCHVEVCAGKGIASLKFLKIVEKWAKEAGCDRMEIAGRKGWERVLDYRVTKVILSKDL